MSMAVPGARLFTNEINLAISRASRSSRPLPLSVTLRREIEHWLFLKSWSGFLPWRSERHHQFVMYTDASSYRWAGVLNPSAVPVYASDYWPVDMIAVKEALALSNALSSFAATIKDSRVDVYVDSFALFHAWNGQSARSHALSNALKSIFEALMSTNCILRLFLVPSVNNLADQPFRSLSPADSRLSLSYWKRLQDAFGGPNGHSVDLMALPSNVMRSSTGVMLPFFSPHPTPGCSGVNVFSQLPDIHPPQLFSNPYVFPPICLIPNVLRFMSSFRVSFTIVVPDVRPRRFWWALLPHCSTSALLLAPEGEVGVLFPPSKSGYQDSWHLPWDLWAFRIDPM